MGHGPAFIRLVGDAHAVRGDHPRLRHEVLLDLSDVPLATGSGFIVSPDGLAVTSLHVVTGETRVVAIRGQKVEVTIDVRRIEVLVSGHARDPAPRRYDASVAASGRKRRGPGAVPRVGHGRRGRSVAGPGPARLR